MPTLCPNSFTPQGHPIHLPGPAFPCAVPPSLPSRSSACALCSYRLFVLRSVDMRNKLYSRTGTWDSSVTGGENSSQTHGFGSKAAKDIHTRLGGEARYTTIGPMPVAEFLETFMDCKDALKRHKMDTVNENMFRRLNDVKTEAEMYDPLVDALNAGKPAVTDSSPHCTGHAFRITAYHPDQAHGTLGSLKPDICCYSIESLAAVQVEGSSRRYSARTVMRLAALFFEIKRNKKLDFFRDPPSNISPSERGKWEFVLHPDVLKTYAHEHSTAQEAFGQHVAYATELCARQHRRCCYSISLSGTTARLIRWDRAGAIVSTAFDIVTSPTILCKFLWCFGHAGLAEQGYDATVTPALMEEKEIFAKAIRQHVYHQLAHLTTKEQDEAFQRHYDREAVSAVEVYHPALEPLGRDMRLLFSRPLAYPLSPTGRGTRGYWAVDTMSHKVYFLKDTWRYRPTDVESRQEGDILKELNSKMVPNVPRVVCHSDVLDATAHLVMCGTGKVHQRKQQRASVQTTRTQRYVEKEWVCGKSRPEGPGKILVRINGRVHYRLVLAEAGYPLVQTFSGTSELLRCAYDVFKALWKANETSGQIVHRDVSSSNIVLYRSSSQGPGGPTTPASRPRRGILIDWDLACDQAEASNDEEPPHSATWIYASVDVASNIQPFNYTIQMDMESLLYVVLHMALIFLPHNLSATAVLDTIYTMFESRGSDGPQAGGAPYGGFGKANNMLNRSHTKPYSWDSPLDEWLNTMISYLAPLVGSKGEDTHGWEPPHVEAYWSSLLKKPMKHMDRIWTLPPELQANAPHLFLGHGYQAPLPAPVPTHLSKRTFEDMIEGRLNLRTTTDMGDSSDGRKVKRARGANSPPPTGKAALTRHRRTPAPRTPARKPSDPTVTLASARGTSSRARQRSSTGTPQSGAEITRRSS
ncbi:hypothetical protein C8Q76DRAFT_476353 [Earliella scabrosa]|nr:hypothetical protein C8Q76DRAFT_476353 [Earliella scabrosa]